MSEDPFELFRRTVAEVNAASGGFDPAEFGALGWAMTPFPPQGVAGVDDLPTPETGTKHAVTQLFSAIEELDGRKFDGDSDLLSLWQDVIDVEGSGSMATAFSREFGRTLLGSYVVWMNSLSQLLVESYSVRIIAAELVVDEHRHSTPTESWLWQLSQSDREELLRRCTDLDDDVVADMEDARERRNELLLAFGRWDDHAIENPVEDARRYLRILNALEKRLVEDDPFEFFPAGASA